MILKKVNVGRIMLLVLPVTFLLLFYFYPIGRMVEVTIGRLNGNQLGVLRWQIIINAIRFTLFQAGISTLLTLLIGVPAAYLFAKFSFPGRDLLKIISTIPFILPTVVVAAGFNAMVGPQGWLNLVFMRLINQPQPVINLQNTFTAILLAHIFYNTSIVIRVVGGAWAQLDSKLEQAAEVLGASRLKVLLHITFPLLLPSIISALLLVFLFDFTSFGVILMLGGPRFSTLETEIYIQTMQFLNLPLAGILSFIQLGFTMAVTGILLKMGGGMVVPIMPRFNQAGITKPDTNIKKIFIGGMIILLIILFVLPLGGLVARSFSTNRFRRDSIDDRSVISFMYYRDLFVNTRQSIFFVPPVMALKNSLIFAMGSSLLALLLGLMLASGIGKKGSGNRVLEYITLLPLGTSAVTLGLGFFIAFSTSFSTIQWYPLIIPAAHTLISLPFVLRVIQPMMDSIPDSLRLAAMTMGASPFQVWRFVELPILWRAVATAFVYAFTISLGEFGATSFLARPEIPTLPVAIYRYLNLPGGTNYGQAMAMAVIILVVCATGIFVLERLKFTLFSGTNTTPHAGN